MPVEDGSVAALEEQESAKVLTLTMRSSICRYSVAGSNLARRGHQYVELDQTRSANARQSHGRYSFVTGCNVDPCQTMGRAFLLDKEHHKLTETDDDDTNDNRSGSRTSVLGGPCDGPGSI